MNLSADSRSPDVARNPYKNQSNLYQSPIQNSLKLNTRLIALDQINAPSLIGAWGSRFSVERA
jgi:hypothetical protein